MTLAVALLVLLAGWLMATVPAGANGVAVALTPSTVQVDPGAAFDLDIFVIQAGASFNGFDAIVEWDPAALTPIFNAEGVLMTSACGNTFHRFRPGASADTIADVLLCSATSLTGPGQIYRLRFQASLTPQVTTVRFAPGLQFYDAGLYVPLDYVGSASVGIGMTPVSAGPPAAPAQLRLRVAPNPARGGTVFTVEADRAGPQSLRVMDARGRVVRRFDDRRAEPGVRTIAWDGRSQAGARVPPGVYLARLEVAGKAVWNRVMMLR
jgi:hypothetical protein